MEAPFPFCICPTDPGIVLLYQFFNGRWETYVRQWKKINNSNFSPFRKASISSVKFITLCHIHILEVSFLPALWEREIYFLLTSLLKEFSSIFSVSASARGFFRVCKNKAAFLLRSACSCFSFDSLEACASFSLAAAANLSSSFCFAKKDN